MQQHHEDEMSAEARIQVCRVRVGGMTCTACSSTIESALSKVNGVKKARVALATEEAELHYVLKMVTCDQLVRAVQDLGFEAEIISSRDDVGEIWLKIEGSDTENSMKVVLNTLETLPGVEFVVRDEAPDNICITYREDLTGPRNFVKAIESIAPGHFRVTVVRGFQQGREARKIDKVRQYLRSSFLWSLVFTVPVFMSSMVLMYVPYICKALDTRLINALEFGQALRCALSTPVQFIIGRRFYTGSIKALRNGSANMDVLIALGTNSAYFYSVYSVIRSATSSFETTDFFETSSMLITIVLLGKYIEVMAKGRTSEAISKLLELSPQKSILLDHDEQVGITNEQEIDSRLLQKDDLIKILPGAKVGSDGLVIWGESRVDESMLTGESKPVTKRKGDQVIGGTVNDNGVLHVKVTKVGSATALAQIVHLVESAQMVKAPIQMFADRISKYFVPLVITLSASTWLMWSLAGTFHWYPVSWIPDAMDGFELALQFGISVMVIACPCALGLATPTAVMVGTGVGASQGVLIKGGQALQSAHKVNCILFDKTGTLTMGKPRVVDTRLLKDMPEPDFYEMIAAAEVNSEHPVAKAIVDYAKQFRDDQEKPTWPGAVDFISVPGHGVKATVKHREVVIGNKSMMLDYNIKVPVRAEKVLSEVEDMARTGILVSIGREVVGIVAVSDPLKPGTREVVSFLKTMKVKAVMITGDNQGTASAIAKEAGIEAVIAEATPAQKAKRVKDLQAQGYTVAMVGDGVNDSPALAVADVGMAIGAGTDIAIEAADIVLMRSNLEDVITAIDLSRRTFARIHWNYIWALGYNVLCIPIAAGALFPFSRFRLPPWIAGAAMAASSICVVCSSLLLKNYRRPKALDKLEMHGIVTEK
ncbi:hypothetical protein MLD38_027783 [Melastoma candidum]|uniref:Uncharacterized protein n=1 Tax=Melastoma candidum TaxID=119954 RepID=A0ACB9P2V1_9MYRT|nr:hypothetical protein MLD38_027783 [Melastoma candidum]